MIPRNLFPGELGVCPGPKGRDNLFSSDRAERSCSVCIELKSGSIVQYFVRWWHAQASTLELRQS